MVLPRFGPCTAGSRWTLAPPPRGVTKWLIPVTDPLFTRSRSEPRPRPQCVTRCLSPVTDPLFTRSRSEPLNALVPGGFGASAPRTPTPTGLFPFSHLVRQAGNTGVVFSKAPTPGPNSSSLTYERNPGRTRACLTASATYTICTHPRHPECYAIRP